MTSVAGIVEYIARTEGPDTSAAVGADIENGRLDETLAASAPGKGKRTRNSAPASSRPSPPHGPQQRPGQQRIDEMLPRQVRPAYPRLPSRLRGQQEASGGRWRRARRARRRSGARPSAQRLQEATAFRAELEAA
eukprot:tig00000114_g6015.t1